MEIITAGVSRLSRECDRTSTGSTRSTGKQASPILKNTSTHIAQIMQVIPDNLNHSSLDKESSPASRSALQSGLPGGNPFEEVKADREEEEEGEGFLDPELSCEVSENDREGDSFNVFPSRADEALKTRKCSECIK